MSGSVDWNYQRAFLAVLDGGSLSAASRALHLSQPTVRARIEALEKATGTVLFTRSAQGLLPTDQARDLGDRVRAMAHASAAFLRDASAPAGRIAGVVRVSASELMAIEVLPPMLARLRIRHPDLLIELSPSNAVANLSEQEADIAVRMHPPRQDTLVIRRIGDVPLGLFAHRDYLAERAMPRVPADLAGHDVIGPDRAVSDLARVRAVLPTAARIVLRTDSHPAQLAAARAGLGIAIIQRPVGLADPCLVPVMPDLVVARLPIWVVSHRDLRRVPRIEAVFDHLVGELVGYLR